ncbi:hypothetical protein CDL12_13897 [Handroanthus impetiginosus]|uniref:O-fucosyltransferase family protein n=1 Tax=Handroanthus impetiginosus TaxID=429701 RepID=A0A2G9H849_9LAMI|nr:hypothetical protein CDL12_13897 [Handroanthus impetiginosus]
MAVDLRQVMAAFLTFSMFIMLGNMIKRDHIDPLLEPLPASPNAQFSALKVSKLGTVKLTEISNGPWKEYSEPPKPCWKNPSVKGKGQSKGYIFFSLTNGPEFHALQIANAVVAAKHLGATLAIPDIRGPKLGQKRHFGEIYDVNKFGTSLSGIVQVDKNPPAGLSGGKLPIVRVPNGVSKDFITSKMEPIFQSKRNLKIVTSFNSSAMAKLDKLSNAYQCMAMFESLKLQPDLQELVDSMARTLRSMSQKTRGHFVAVDLRVDMLERKSCKEMDGSSKKCYDAEEMTNFLKKIGFPSETAIYLTQTGSLSANLHNSLQKGLADKNLMNPRNIISKPSTCNVICNHFDAIIPADEKAKFLGSERSEYEKFIDFYICTQGDVFVPAFPSRFYASVVGKRVAYGNTQILVPAKNDSASATDYISPYIAKKSHFAYSCFC